MLHDKLQNSEIVKAYNEAFSQQLSEVLNGVLSLLKEKATRYDQEESAWQCMRTPEMYAFMIQTKARRISSESSKGDKEQEDNIRDIIAYAAMFLADIQASRDRDPDGEEEPEGTIRKEWGTFRKVDSLNS